MAGLGALRREGTAVFMGACRRRCRYPYQQIRVDEITIRAVFMYPRMAPRELANRVNAGMLDFAGVYD